MTSFLRHMPVLHSQLCYGQSEVETLFDEVLWNQICENFEKLRPHTIFSSPLERCAGLARLLQQKFGTPVIYDNRLLEMNFGLWELKNWDDIDRKELDLWAKNVWSYPFPNGESAEIVFERVQSFRAEFKSQLENALVISHSGVLKLWNFEPHHPQANQHLQKKYPYATWLTLNPLNEIS